MSLPIPSIPPALASYASRLRAEFSVDRATDELLLDELVTAALRLKALHSDPRALDPLGQPSWGREHEKASRAYHRSLRALLLAQRRPSGPRPSYTPARPEKPTPMAPGPNSTKPASPSAATATTTPSSPPTTTAPHQITPIQPATNPPRPSTSPHISTIPAPTIPSPFDRPRRPDPRQALEARRRARSKVGAHGRDSPRPGIRPGVPSSDQIPNP